MKNFNRESGVILAVSLLMLLLLTLLALTAMQSTLFQEKMSSNMQDKEFSFQAAESVLKEGEAWILGLTIEPKPLATCTAKPCALILNPNLNPELKSKSWWTTNANPYTNATLAKVKTQPQFLVEFFRFVPDSPAIGKGVPTGVYYYRLTARGTGLTDTAQTILQTTVGRRF